MFTTHFPGNGKHTTYKNGDDWGMVQMALFYPHDPNFRHTQGPGGVPNPLHAAGSTEAM